MKLLSLILIAFAAVASTWCLGFGAERKSDNSEISSTFARVIKVDAPRSITVKVTSDKTLYIATNDKTEIKKNGADISLLEIEKDDLVVMTYTTKDNKYIAVSLEVRGKAGTATAEPKKKK